MKNITIIGGTSGFGKWLAEYLLKNFSNISLTITGTNEKKAKKISSEINCNYNTNNVNAVLDADVIIFSVPISLTEKVIGNVGNHIKSGAIVLDVTSIKQTPTNAMKKFIKNDVLIIPTHPMFGPFISTIAGQIILLTPDEKTKKDKRYKIFVNYLKKEHAKTYEISPIKHDKMMAIIQGLTHYNMFVLGETIKKLNVDIKQSFDFVSPIYKILISSIGRYTNQNPELYGDIQISNPEIQHVHKTFIDTAKDYYTYIKNKDKKSFVNSLKNTKKYFGDNSNYGQKYTDKIVFMISRQIEKAEKNIGKKISIMNIYSKDIIKGSLIQYENEIIILENNNKYDINEWEIL